MLKLLHRWGFDGASEFVSSCDEVVLNDALQYVAYRLLVTPGRVNNPAGLVRHLVTAGEPVPPPPAGFDTASLLQENISDLLPSPTVNPLELAERKLAAHHRRVDEVIASLTLEQHASIDVLMSSYTRTLNDLPPEARTVREYEILESLLLRSGYWPLDLPVLTHMEVLEDN